MIDKATGLLVGAVLAAAIGASAPAYAQRNPFVPGSGASKQEVERIVDERMRAMEARLEAASRTTTGKPGSPVPGGPLVPGVPGAPASGPGSPIPGGPAGGPLTPGSSVAPGAIAPYGSPNGMAVGGMGMGATQGAIASARSSDVRFLGCINGQPKFVRKGSGERVVFTTREINDATKAGILPACR